MLPDTVHERKAGDPISARAWNVIARLATRLATYPGVIATPVGVAVIPPAAAPSDTTTSTLRFARITARAGTAPPFIYSAVEVVPTGNPFELAGWTTKSGGQTISYRLVNIHEVGELGYGVRPVPNNSIVPYWDIGRGWFVTCVMNYRGTY